MVVGKWCVVCGVWWVSGARVWMWGGGGLVGRMERGV